MSEDDPRIIEGAIPGAGDTSRLAMASGMFFMFAMQIPAIIFVAKGMYGIGALLLTATLLLAAGFFAYLVRLGQSMATSRVVVDLNAKSVQFDSVFVPRGTRRASASVTIGLDDIEYAYLRRGFDNAPNQFIVRAKSGRAVIPENLSNFEAICDVLEASGNEQLRPWWTRDRSRVLAFYSSIVLFAIAFAVSGLAVINVVVGPSSTPNQPFNQAVWAVASSSVRGKMIDDLLEKQLIVGMHRGDVETLLGRPFGPTRWSPDHPPSDDQTWWYDIGSEEGFLWVSDKDRYLRVTFDPSEVATSAEVITR